MEQEARANFRVIRINRWSLALVVLVALAALLLPVGRLFSGPASMPDRVAPGVSLLGRDLGGLSAEEARRILEQMAAMQPVTPDSAPAAVQLDVETTLFRLLTAPAHAAVEPAWVPAGGVDGGAAAGQLGSGPAAPAAGPAGAGAPGARTPVRSAPPGKKAVTLLINVAWGDQHLPPMLATLRRHQVRTTFLVVGRWAEKRQDLLKRMAADGHEIGNHGYNDGASPLALLRSGRLRADIQRAGELLSRITGQRPRFYQPHRGEVDEKGQLVRIARELGYTTVLWSRDTLDWKPAATAASIYKVVAAAQDGDIILMHPTAATEKALGDILTELERKGLRVLPLRELLAPGTDEEK